MNSRAHAGVQPGRVICGPGCVNLWADDLHNIMLYAQRREPSWMSHFDRYNKKSKVGGKRVGMFATVAHRPACTISAGCATPTAITTTTTSEPQWPRISRKREWLLVWRTVSRHFEFLPPPCVVLLGTQVALGPVSPPPSPHYRCPLLGAAAVTGTCLLGGANHPSIQFQIQLHPSSLRPPARSL